MFIVYLPFEFNFWWRKKIQIEFPSEMEIKLWLYIKASMTSKHNQFRIFNLIESLEDSGWRQFYLNVLLLNVIISNKFPRIPIKIERRVHNHIFYLGTRNKWINSINIGNFVVIRWNDCQNCVSCFRKYMNLNILVVIINVFV